MIHLIVTAPLGDKERWTRDHTGTMLRAFGAGFGTTAVVIVDGEVDPEALVLNMLPQCGVHVIEGLALANCCLDIMPHLVVADSVCKEEGLTEVSELPRVKSSAPEVQLLRARENDILAYPPTPGEGFEPSGQVSDWVARIVVI